MITLCILLYVLGALPVYAIAEEVRNDQNTNLDLIIVTATWPLAVVYGCYVWRGKKSL